MFVCVGPPCQDVTRSVTEGRQPAHQSAALPESATTVTKRARAVSVYPEAPGRGSGRLATCRTRPAGATQAGHAVTRDGPTLLPPCVSGPARTQRPALLPESVIPGWLDGRSRLSELVSDGQ
jgi:hypothetical protein